VIGDWGAGLTGDFLGEGDLLREKFLGRLNWGGGWQIWFGNKKRVFAAMDENPSFYQVRLRRLELPRGYPH
jgi:hypothetical protein